MMTAQIVGSWTAQRTPMLLEDYSHPGVQSCNDVTGTAYVPPSPNLGVWEVVCEDVVLALIETDVDYMVLWSEEVVDAQTGQ